MNAQYYQQAFEHLTTALKLNSTLLTSYDDTKPYHANILTLLGRCYMEGGKIFKNSQMKLGGNLDDALDLLEKSLKMNKAILGDDDFTNCSIYTIIAHVYIKKKQYDNAIQHLSKVFFICFTSHRSGKCLKRNTE